MAFINGTLDAQRLASIEEHLMSCVSCRGRMMDLLQMTRSGADALYDRLPSEPYLFEPGEWVGRRYRVQASLGRGGMGEVYEAFDHVLATPVALKTIIATQSDNRECIQRLFAEARIAKRVTHPNVCRPYEIGIHEGDVQRGERLAYVTMELIAGESLGRRVRERGGLGLDEVAGLGHEILAGLSALHQAQIVHRDIKSDNILLRKGAPEGHRAVIIDFGLAVEGECERGTRSGQVLSTPAGTVAYMAPEQLAGRPVTPSTDVYGFGVTLFEMLSGRSPFSGRARLSGQPPRLPASVLCEPPRRERLDGYLARCLHPAPEARFSHAGEALGAFERLW